MSVRKKNKYSFSIFTEVWKVMNLTFLYLIKCLIIAHFIILCSVIHLLDKEFFVVQLFNISYFFMYVPYVSVCLSVCLFFLNISG